MCNINFKIFLFISKSLITVSKNDLIGGSLAGVHRIKIIT